jgi:Fur family transcriptional regulator, zinc uptake regulator
MKGAIAKFPESKGKHDHDRCVSRIMRAAEKVCEKRQLQLTPIRKRVLELITQRHAPIGAYEILSAIKKGEAAQAPPTVYRALEFLLEAGLIHRIDTLNAFIACEMPESVHAGQFLVCRNCSKVVELDDPAISRLLVQKAKALGFTADPQDVEVKGLCSACQSADEHDD